MIQAQQLIVLANEKLFLEHKLSYQQLKLATNVSSIVLTFVTKKGKQPSSKNILIQITFFAIVKFVFNTHDKFVKN